MQTTINFQEFERRLDDIENYFLERLRTSNFPAYLQFKKQIEEEKTQEK